MLACAGALSGCGSVLTASTADVAGIAGAGVAGAVSRSPAAATGIGLGIAAGANAGLQSVERDVHRAEQDRIAQAAGPLAPGVVGHWSVTHSIPIENDEHGDLVVTRVIGAADFNCKEIVFSVDAARSKPDATQNKPDASENNSHATQNKTASRAFYTATVCLDGADWKWASAEPATARWGALQ